MSDKRIYLVKPAGKDDGYLVNAQSASQALRHVADKLFSVKVCTPVEALALGTKGVKLEEAGD